MCERACVYTHLDVMFAYDKVHSVHVRELIENMRNPPFERRLWISYITAASLCHCFFHDGTVSYNLHRVI